MSSPPTGVVLERLRQVLNGAVDGEVRFDAGSRAIYSTDASNYRQVPIEVIVPRTIDAAVAAIAVSAQLDVPVLCRGGGTSLARKATNAAVVLDWSKCCHRLVEINTQDRTGRARLAAAPTEPIKRDGPSPRSHLLALHDTAAGPAP